MKRGILSLAFMCLGAPAEAKLTKYYYLAGFGGPYAVKSREACEAQKRRFDAFCMAEGTAQGSRINHDLALKFRYGDGLESSGLGGPMHAKVGR